MACGEFQSTGPITFSLRIPFLSIMNVSGTPVIPNRLAAELSGSRYTGKVYPFSFIYLNTLFLSSLKMIVINVNLGFPDRLLNSPSMDGNSSTHDWHHVAQKLMNTTEPFTSEIFNLLLLISVISISGAASLGVDISGLYCGLTIKKAILIPESRIIKRIRVLFFNIS